MKLIVGLGNPGEKYSKNRHNVGYVVIDALKKKKISANLLMRKTQVFMNESGDLIKSLVDQYSINMPDLWVIHDDLDIKLGEYKIQKGKGPREHKGLLSIYEALGTRDFWHVRVGVDNREKLHSSKASRGKEYVLQDFTQEEMEKVNRVIDELVNLLYADLASS